MIGLGILFMFNPIECVWMPRCLFRCVTGLSCPGCGTLRAVHAALHGRLREAVAFNYWLLLALPYVVAVAVGELLPAGRARDSLRRLTEHRVVIAFYLVTFFVWLVIRNVCGI